jgi:hypothetical protein
MEVTSSSESFSLSRASTRFFGFGFVNLVGLNRQIGEDRNAGGCDFDESSAGR